MTVETEFLRVAAENLLECMTRIEACVPRLTTEQVWARGAENQNAVGNLLLHLNGNVRQWILHGVGGQSDMRDRDSEFAAREGAEAAVLTTKLRATLDEAVNIIRSLPSQRLLDALKVQGYDVTVLRAIYHVGEHFSGHTFQIIAITKQFTGADLGFYRHLSGAKAKNSAQS